MSAPTLKVEAAFGEDPLAAAPSWTDITAYVRSYSIQRGRSREQDRDEASVATIVLDNRDRRFEPDYVQGAYYLAQSPPANVIKPRVKIRITTTDNNTSPPTAHRRFVGYVERWPQALKAHGHDNEVAITASDAFKTLAGKEYSGTIASALSGTMLGDLLDNSINLPAGDRDLDTGQETLQAYEASQEATLAILQALAESDMQGRLFVARDGKLTFYDRHAAYTSGATVQTIFCQTQSFSGPSRTAFRSGGGSLDDMKAGGTYNQATTVPPPQKWVVEIDSTGGASDTYKWSNDGGSTWQFTNLTITAGTWLSLSLNVGAPPGSATGIFVRFGASTGHVVGDRWEFYIGGYGFADIGISYDDEEIFNEIVCERRGADTPVYVAGGSPEANDAAFDMAAFSGTTQLQYVVEIDGVGTGAGGVDTFRWSDDGGTTWDVSTVDITGSAQTLNNGVTVTFSATTGHNSGDQWSQYTPGVSQDTASQASYMKRTLRKSDLLSSDATTIQDYASVLGDKYDEPGVRFEALTLRLHDSDTDLWAHVLGAELGQRFKVSVHNEALGGEYWASNPETGSAQDIEQDIALEGYTESWDCHSPEVWDFAWTLSPWDTTEYWILGTSILGTSTRLGF